MRGKRLGLLGLLVLFLLPLRVCFAHPMGNFSVNHYAKITLAPDGIRLRYYIDLAEIPTYQELQQYNITPTDTAALAPFLAQRGAELERGLSLRIDGAAVPLQMVSKGVIFPPGAGGLPTMKLGYVFLAAYPHAGGDKAASTANLAYSDNNFPGHAGWKEVVVTGPPSLLLASSASSIDRSAGLSNYPTSMLSSAPQDLTATVRFTIPAPPVAETAALPAKTAAHAHAETGAVSPQRKAVSHAEATAQVAASGSAAVARAPHTHHAPAALHPAGTQSAVRATLAAVLKPVSLEPMHLEANRQGTARNAFTQLVTAQHLSLWFLFTAAFISMGLGALHALEPGHGKTIVAAYLVGSKGTARHAMLLGIIVTAAHTASVFALGAITLYASHYILPEQLYPWLGVLSGLTIAALGGYMLLRRWTGEAMEHDHTVGEMHGHWFSQRTKQTADLAAAAAATPADTTPETIPGTTPGTNLGTNLGTTSETTRTVSLTQLFTLGITGGIIPCPAALVVLLSAFSLHRVGFGFFLITAFSVGLAAVLIGFGLMMVYARRFISRLHVDGPLTRRWLPVASAAFMTLLGAAIAVRAFATTGITAHSFSLAKLGPALFVAGLGLVLGIRHSTDADHVVAISTIITKQRGSIRGAALIGTLWGLGHTLTIFVVGCLIILFGVVIPPRVGLSMEFSVGLMLILLGLLNLTGMMQKMVARFTPKTLAEREPAGREPVEPEPACAPLAPVAPMAQAAARGRSRLLGRTIGRYGAYQCLRPLAIGLVHGLAGSAAVALLVLSTIHNPLWAIVYLVIFGAGTMLGMMCMTAAMALPLVYSADRMPQLSRYMGVASGLVSVCFGTFLVYHLGYLGGLFTSHPHWTPQ